MDYIFISSQALPHVIRGTLESTATPLFQCGSRSGNFHYLRVEVSEWLSSNVGAGNSTFAQFGLYENMNWYVHKFNQSFLICFRQKSHAALFKLAWS